MTVEIWVAIAVIASGSFAIGLLVGLGLRQYALARQGLLLADVVRDGTVAQYAVMRDGRDANRMPEDRYAEGAER